MGGRWRQRETERERGTERSGQRATYRRMQCDKGDISWGRTDGSSPIKSTVKLFPDGNDVREVDGLLDNMSQSDLLGSGE